MNKDYLPSKKFIRLFVLIVGAALAIWGLVSLVNYFKKRSAEKNTVVTTLTIKDVIEADADKDGVPDWEEALWGLDIHNPETNSIPDRTYITERQSELAVKGEQEGKPVGEEILNETDQFAREYLVTMLSLNQKGQMDEESTKALAANIADSVKSNNTLPEIYSAKDLKVVPATEASINEYQLKLGEAFAKNGIETLGTELPLLTEILENNNTENIPKMKAVTEKYAFFAQSMMSISVPDTAVTQHIEFANTLYKIGKSTENLIQGSGNPLIAIIGVNQYFENFTALQTVTESLGTYFEKNGIVQ